MYRKNTAGQFIYFALVNAASGAALTGATVTAYRSLDNAAQASATGTTTELGNGQYRFDLSQADTNGDYGSFLFIATGAVPVEKTVVFTGANITLDAFGAALASAWTSTRAGYLDSVVLAQNANQRTVQITGSNHIAADVHEFQAGVITAGDFAANAITAAALATDAVAEIQSGLATTAGVDAALTEIKGAGWDSSTDTLEKIRDASGGATVNVLPLAASDPQRQEGTTVYTFVGDTSAVTVSIYDSNDQPVDLDGLTLRVTVEDRTANTDILNDESPTVQGAGNNQVVFQPTSTTQQTTGTYYWAVRNTSNGAVKGHGKYLVSYAAAKNP